MNAEQIYKLTQGVKAYFPPEFDTLPIIEKEDIYVKISKDYEDDYNEYYSEKLEKIFEDIGNIVMMSPFAKQKLMYLVQTKLNELKFADHIIQNFGYEFEDVSHYYSPNVADFDLKCFDSPKYGTARLKRFEIFVDKKYNMNIHLIEDKRIPIHKF